MIERIAATTPAISATPATPPTTPPTIAPVLVDCVGAGVEVEVVLVTGVERVSDAEADVDEATEVVDWT